MYFVHPCRIRVVSWVTELLTFASRQFAPKIVDLSVRFFRIVFNSPLRARVVDGGSRPRSEAPCRNQKVLHYHTVTLPLRRTSLSSLNSHILRIVR